MWPRTATAASNRGLTSFSLLVYLARSILLVLAATLFAGCASKVATVSLMDVVADARITPPADATRQLDALVAPSPAVALGKPVSDKPAESAATDIPVFALSDAIEIALRENPRLRVATASVERARGQSEVAFAPFLPEVDLFTRYGGASATLSPGAPGPVGAILPSGDGARGYVQAEFDLQWTVWDFGRRNGHYGQALSRERISALQLVRARQTVAFDVTTAYLGVILSQAARNIQEQAIRRAQAALDDARARRAGGVAEKDDILRAELLVAEARDSAVAATQAEYDAVSRLNYALGRNASLPLRVVARDNLPGFNNSLDDCLKTAASQREEIAIARESVTGARSGLEAAQGDFLPLLYVRLGVGHVDGEGVRTGFHEGAAIHLDQKLYTGGRRNGERDSARADILAATASSDAILDTIGLEVNLAFRAVTASADRIRLAETAKAQATEYLRLVRVRYKNGNATPIDIVDAETQATRSDLRYQTAIYEHLAAIARLDYAMGTGVSK
jgi:outer membrane protein